MNYVQGNNTSKRSELQPKLENSFKEGLKNGGRQAQ